MLCTRCSQVIKPIVAIDIDGTLGDYHGHFERFAEKWLGLDLAPYKPYSGTERYGEWFSGVFGVSLETFREVKLAFRMGGLKRSMPMRHEADLMTRQLREDGFEVWLVTNRPYLKVTAIDPDTRFWLALHEISYDHLLYGPEKYRKLLEQVDKDRIVAVVDDDIGQISDALDLELNPILLRTKYNRGCNHDSCAQSLYQLIVMLEVEQQIWKRSRIQAELSEQEIRS